MDDKSFDSVELEAAARDAATMGVAHTLLSISIRETCRDPALTDDIDVPGARTDAEMLEVSDMFNWRQRQTLRYV